MKKSKFPISDKEKLKYAYNTFPPGFRSKFEFNVNETYKQLCERIKYNITMKSYASEWNNNNEDTNSNKSDDDTKSINFINKINNPSITNENLMLKHKNTRVLKQLNTIKYLFNTNNYNKDEWLYDSGTGEHTTNNKSILRNFKNEKINLSCANGTKCTFDGYGETILNINNYKIKLNRVLYSKDVTKNMISGIELAKIGIKVIIEEINNNVTLKMLDKNYKTIASFQANKRNEVNFTNVQNKKKYEISNNRNNIMAMQNFNNYQELLWHRRIGHYYNEDMQKYLQEHGINNHNCCDE